MESDKVNQLNIKVLRYAQQFGRFCKEKPLGAFGTGLFIVMIALAIGANVWATMDPISSAPSNAFASPSREFWFGTDYIGRDMWSRFVYGARTSISVAVPGVALATVIGGFLGILCGYVGGKVDLFVQRVMDVLLSFPVLLMGLAIMAVLGQALVNVTVTLGIIYTPRINRLSRSVALSIKEQPYIEAAKVEGSGFWYIFSHHLFQNSFPHWFVYATSLLAGGFLVEAGLSFLGLGVPPPYASWGRDLSTNVPYFYTAPWLAVFPGMGITMAVLGANLLGDALRDVLDPRLKRI